MTSLLAPQIAQGPRPVVLTCEHATPHVPEGLLPLFAAAAEALGLRRQDSGNSGVSATGAGSQPATPEVDTFLQQLLQSHRGFDGGAADVAHALGAALDVRPLMGEVSRLVVDLNRSLHHPRLFSQATAKLSEQGRQGLLQRYWQPHRDRVQAQVAAHLQHSGRCAHLALHSFTPVWQGVPRPVDIGLLYDPSRACERALATCVLRALRRRLPELRLRRNQPYRGVSDGLPTALRKQFQGLLYAGIEIEVSQRLVHTAHSWPPIQAHLVAACVEGVDNFAAGHDSF